MSNIKPSDHGIVVEHKETQVRYAISDHNYNEKVHRKVRDLKPGESVRSFRPKRLVDAGSEPSEGGSATRSGTGTPEAGEKPAPTSSEALADGLAKTEGAAPAASQDKKGN
jgi:hypothetical protein